MSEDSSEHLTKRQREILELICEGLTIAEMARRLYLSPHTVKTYVSQLFDVTGTNSQIQLVVWAFRRGVLT